MSQIALPLAWPVDEAEDDFIVTPSNAEAVRRIQAPGTWPVRAILLTGPRKSGRSLFGRIAALRHSMTLIDDADRVDEAAIFNAWNSAQTSRRPLLLIADVPPPVWTIRLPDLRSRLLATPQVAFNNPDEALMQQLLEALCRKRGLTVAPDVTRWLLRRIERSHHAVIAAVDRLDAAALAQRRTLTLSLVRSVMADPVDALEAKA